MSDSKSSAKPFIIVDGSSYLYRAYHAMPALSNSHGESTGAIYGVVNMLGKLVKEYEPKYFAVVFDAKGKTFRNELYPDYKANRPPMPADLRSQVKPLKDLIHALGFPLLEVQGVEADDVIGTLVSQAVKLGWSVLISTGDKDMAQLVNDQVSLVNTMDNTRLDRSGVVNKFKVLPERIVDYLALVGDKVDNIPGVPGVGPKTAVKWLAEHGSMQEIIDQADKVRGKIGEKLRATVDQLPLSHQLATIKCDVELELTPSDLRRGSADPVALREIYGNLEFRTWLAALGGEQTNNDPKKSQGDYRIILSLADLEAWLSLLEQAPVFAFDTETTSLNYMSARVVGVSFAVKEGEAAYLPIGHDYPGVPEQLDETEVFGRLKRLLEDPAIKKLGHNLKYDRNVLANHGIALTGIAYDTMLESYVINSTANRHDLDTLCQKHLQHSNIHFEDVAGKGSKQITFDKVDLDKATAYAAEDADMTLRLHQHFWPQLRSLENQCRLYESIEIPLIEVLSRVERNGVLVDAQRLQGQSRELAAVMDRLVSEATELAGESFNLSSPKQIQKILFERQGLPIIRKTPKGQPSTAEDVLQELAHDYPLPRLILEHRSLSKLKSTYTDKLPKQINPRTGRVHTSYQQAVASTGRLSSTDPNLQNIPIRSMEGRRIRQAFIASPGHKILAADYSQIELRIMAHLSGDEGLCQAFSRGLDIHCATASEVFAVSVEDVDAAQRRAAKAINFGLIYGMSAFGLARQLGITRPAAQEYVNSYFSRYPGVKKYMDQTREKAREIGYVQTLFGRRLYLPEINSRNAQRRQYAERTAINAPMQGSAADIIKRAMIDVDAWIRACVPDALMIMQVHDELVFEVAEQDVERVLSAVKERMVSAAELTVPLEVDAAIGLNWDEAH
ncbi:MAG: DNA polymerase I [Gammaproteobacteria bacterium]|nr:DNA polymerase I [Gammaproteobacteria bacterium]